MHGERRGEGKDANFASLCRGGERQAFKFRRGLTFSRSRPPKTSADRLARVRRPCSRVCTNVRKIRADRQRQVRRREERRGEKRRGEENGASAASRLCVAWINNRTKSTRAIDRSAGRASPVMVPRGTRRRRTYLFEDAADVRGDEEDRDAVARHSRARWCGCFWSFESLRRRRR